MLKNSEQQFWNILSVNNIAHEFALIVFSRAQFKIKIYQKARILSMTIWVIAEYKSRIENVDCKCHK